MPPRPHPALWTATAVTVTAPAIIATAAWRASTSSAGVAAATASPIATAAVGGIIADIGGTETAFPSERGDVRPQSGTPFYNKPFASFSQQRSAVLPTYTLRRFSRPTQGWHGPTDDVREVEAADDGQAVLIAQAVAAEPDSDLLAIELRDADERMIWSLMRGETISQRPSEAL